MPPIRQAKAERGKAGNHFRTGSQPEKAAAIREQPAARPAPRSFAGQIKQLFRQAAKAVITDPAPKPIRRKGGEDTGRAGFRIAGRIILHRTSPREPLRREHADISPPSSKNDIINWLRAQGYSWAAIRALFPGFFPDEPPQSQAAAYLADTLDWLELWQQNGSDVDDVQSAQQHHLYPHL